MKTSAPAVVKTVPQAGDTQVDADRVTEIRVVFSKEMMDRSWSWSQVSDQTFPRVTGDPHYDKDRRTCVLPVKLEPGKAYALWLNSEKFTNFRDTDGTPAVPYLLVFETRPVRSGATAKKHQARIVGRVRDAAGQPLADATVLVNRCQDALVEIARMKTTTGNDGTYVLPLEFWGGEALSIREIWAEKKGYVRAEKHGVFPLKPGATLKLDLALVPGEVLQGVIKVPLTLTERQAGFKESDQVHLFTVAGPGFEQLFTTQGGGRFEVYVPPGDYAVRLLTPSRTEWKQLRSGSKDLTLTPPRPAFDEALRARAFDLLWGRMDREYSYFFLKKDVDWTALKNEYRPRALAAPNVKEYVGVLREMLARLRDPHVWIATPEGPVGTYRSPTKRNYNRAAVLAALATPTKCGDFALVAKTKADGFGYFLMTHQSAATPEGVRRAVQAVRGLGDVPGFVVDLREADGGNELFAREIATLFCGRDTVYARSKYRAGDTDHKAFGRTHDRILPASREPIR